MYETIAVIIAIIILWHTFKELYNTINFKKERTIKRLYDSLRHIEIYMSILVVISVTKSIFRTINGKQEDD